MSKITVKRLLIMVMFLSGCQQDMYLDGYDDGIHVGYDAVCNPEITHVIAENWDNQSYSQGYYHGTSDGIHNCLIYIGSGDYDHQN